ncbi:hypothetical protein KAR91_88140 [Candidatus Pacearchaeota archaeon]|nr:hypothetical protein [Candidatus Pacearchaeota archaeon]
MAKQMNICNNCKEPFTANNHNTPFCPNIECQKVRTEKNKRRAKKQQQNKKKKIRATTGKVCTCCNIRKVPKDPVNGVQLTMLCAQCFQTKGRGLGI